MAAFHVFVEGAADDSLESIEKLADAIAKHYGLPSTDLLSRLRRGRFRVKGNCDQPTAAAYKRDLERLGARVSVEEATAENSGKATPLPFPAVRPATPPAGVSQVAQVRAQTEHMAGLPPRAPAAASSPPPRASTPPATNPTPTPPPTKPTPTPPAGVQFQSGLSAAFSGETPAADLGALGRVDAAFSLSSVDGNDTGNVAAIQGSFEPPSSSNQGLSASIGPAPEKAPSAKKETKAEKAKPERPKDEPLDMFLPPDAQSDELKVDIADDEKEFSARKRASTPPPMEVVGGGQAAPNTPAGRKSQPSISPVGDSPGSQVPNTPATRKSQPSIQPPSVMGGSAVPSKLGPLGDERVRFVAGVLLAIGIGFAPAHVVAGMREDSTYKTIDTKVHVAQQQADSPEMYAMLDRMRSDQLDRKKTEQRNAAIIGLAVWALVAAGIAFVWFKKVPWENFE